MPIEVISTLKPKNSGQFPVVEDVDIMGGFRSVADEAERDSIPQKDLKEGMLVYVVDKDKYYSRGASGWIEKPFQPYYYRKYVVHDQLNISLDSIFPYTFQQNTNTLLSINIMSHRNTDNTKISYYTYNILVNSFGGTSLKHTATLFSYEPDDHYSFVFDVSSGSLDIKITTPSLGGETAVAKAVIVPQLINYNF